MNKPISFLLLIVFSLLTKPAIAAGSLTQCAQSRESSVEYLRCLDRKLSALNNEITLWNNNKIFALEAKAKDTGRKDVLHLFKKAQKSFTKYRENNCRWQYLEQIPDTTAGAISYKECLVEMSRIRVQQLKKVSQE